MFASGGKEREALGYSGVKAGSVSDVVVLRETSGTCVVILLEHLLDTPGETIPASVHKDDFLISAHLSSARGESRYHLSLDPHLSAPEKWPPDLA